MGRKLVENHLAEAREHLVTGQRAIFRQRELITLLERDGEDTEEAIRLLASFEHLQKLHEAEHERLIRELDHPSLKAIGQVTRAPDVDQRVLFRQKERRTRQPDH